MGTTPLTKNNMFYVYLKIINTFLWNNMFTLK